MKKDTFICINEIGHVNKVLNYYNDMHQNSENGRSTFFLSILKKIKYSPE